MSSEDARPEITGETTVTLWDQFKAFYWGAPWLWWTLAVCVLITYLATLASPDDDADSDSFVSLPVIGGLVALLWIAIIVFSYWRLSREQKQVRYRVTTQEIEIRDGTGAAIAIPWTVVKRCVETRSALLFRLRPSGLRWLPKRAFADVTGLRGLAAQCLGSKAKLRRSE
jgi:YcxB-like protein